MKRLFVTIGIAIGLFLFALPGYASMTETNGGDPPLLLAGNFTESANDSGAGFAGSDLLLYIPSLISAIKSPAAINLTADPTQILADGTSTSNIQAVVTKPNGQHVEDGTEVAFSTNLGTISPNASPTNNGYAWATLTSATVDGTATVTARAGRISQTVPVELKKPVAGITLAASPLNIPADGTTYSIITATLTDGSGQPAPKGTEMTFETTSGTFLPSDQIQTYTVATADDSGMMVVFLRGTTADTATITVTSGGETSNEVYVAIFAAGPFAMTLQADPSSLPADGSSISAIRATVTDGGGSAVEDGTIVSFDVITGTGILSAPTAATTGGIATVTYTASITPGAETIRADTANGVFDTVNITLTGPTVGSVTVTPGSSTIIADGVSSTLIFAHVTDTGGSNIPNGTVVTFTTTAGGFSEVTTTVDGIATAKLTSSTNRGTATIRATAGGVTGTTTVSFIAGPPDQVIVTANPANLTADGTSTSTVGITVLDANDNPVENGSTLTLSAATGTLDHLTATTSDGVASVTYTAPNFVPSGNQDTVTVVTTNGTTGSVHITLVGPQIATITLSANPTSLPADGTSTATISATLTVVGGEGPPDGTTVNFSITQGGGTITPTATTGGGVASATLTSGSTAETATIQAVAGGRTAQIDVDYTPGSVTLTIVPNALLGTGDQSATVTVTLKEADGTAPDTDQTVDFSLSDDSLGEIDPSVVVPGGQGEAEVTFDANAKGGTVTVTGTWNTGGVDVSGSEDIVIHPPPVYMQVAAGYPDPTSISIKGTGGQSTSQIVFDVKDLTGNLVVDGYRVDFVILSSPNGGEEIAPLFATTTNGQVSTILRSGYKSGPISIKATYHHDTNVSTVTGEITIVAGPPVGEEFGISAQYINISGLQTMGLEDRITVSAGDIYGNAIPDDTAISFKTYNTGGIFNPGRSFTTGGTASNILRSASDPTPVQGFVSMTAEAINGGRTTHVTSMAVAPASKNIVYAGTDGGGVYKSNNYGVTWQNVSRSSTVPGRNWIDPYVNDIAVDPNNNNTIFAATGYLGSGYVYRSFDGGGSWNSNYPEEYYGILTNIEDIPRNFNAVLTVLADDNSTYLWVGTQGDGVCFTYDGTRTPSVTWHQASAGLSSGKTVTDMVKAPGTNGNTAVLYAGAATGVYRSTDGGQNWTETANFTGDNIKTLALHPTSDGITDIIYAGTNDAGVWVSTDSGGSWTQYVNGIGKGLSASTPVADVNNIGTGVMSAVTVGEDAESEFWIVTCTATTPSAIFSVYGTVSGDQPDYDISTGDYTIANVLSFSITPGATDFVEGDFFYFSTTRDPGRGIKDLLVDAGNNLLYAVTYFWGPLEPHAVGNVYVIGLDSNQEPIEPWTEANTDLPEYDPPDDRTLFAQHALVSDIPPYDMGAATALYIGGEGINLYKAVSGLSAGAPAWHQSKSALTNLVMARMPVLFSGVCHMDISTAFVSAAATPPRAGYNSGNGVMSPVVTTPTTKSETWTVTYNGTYWGVSGSVSGAQSNIATTGVPYTSDSFEVGFTITTGSIPFASGDNFTFTCIVTYMYTVYIQDSNGNPPISGSRFTVTTYDDIGLAKTILDITYPDTYTYQGTWRDPLDPLTDKPYRIQITYKEGTGKVDRVAFAFVPTCEAGVPGCSGSARTEYHDAETP